MSNKQQPQITPLTKPFEGERYQHPAFGLISVVKGTGSGDTQLFGSNLRHNSALTITISTASLDRHLNRDWFHEDRTVCSFQMSESQWAAFVASQGGTPVPITLEYRPKEGWEVERAPGIDAPESMLETFDREVQEKCEQFLSQAAQLTESIKQLVAAGKAGKGQLTELEKLSKSLSEGLPRNMAFIQRSLQEAMEKTVKAGQIEIESYVYDLAQRTGIQALAENKVSLIEGQKARGVDDNE